MARPSMFFLIHTWSVLTLTTIWTLQSIFLLHCTNFPPSYFSHLTILSDKKRILPKEYSYSHVLDKACESIQIPSSTKVTKPTVHESYQLCSHLELRQQFKFSQNMCANKSEHTVFSQEGCSLICPCRRVNK